MESQDKESVKKHAIESTSSDVKIPNAGAGPVKSVADGGVKGEAKQKRTYW